MTAVFLILLSSWSADMIADRCEQCPECCVIMCERAYPIGTNEPAPCDGVLLPEAMTRDLLKVRDLELPKCLADSEHASESAKLQINECAAERKALGAALRETSEELDRVSIEPPAPMWYERPAFWFAAGVLVGAVSVGAAAR